MSSEYIQKYHWDMTIMPSQVQEVRSSDLSRSSAEVFAAATDHPVRVTRRDGEPLVLMSESQDTARRRLLELAAQLIAVATDTQGSLTERMTHLFPWMHALSPTDRKTCAEEVLAAAQASFSTQQAHLALAELTSWRETATALTAGLQAVPVEWLKDGDVVERP